MPAQTANAQPFEATVDQLSELNERLVKASKKAGHLYIDSYEKTVHGATAFEKKVADATQNEYVQTIVAAQVDLTRDLAKTYASSARDLIK